MVNTFDSYQAYLRAAGLAKTNPALSTIMQKQPLNFQVSRGQPFSNNPNRLSSSWMGNIKYLPYSNVAFVNIGNSEYYYGMTPAQLATWLNSRSLGSYFNNFIKMK